MTVPATLQSINYSGLTFSNAVEKDWDATIDAATSPSNVVYQEFLSALAKCFLVIFIGYLAAKLRLLNEHEANGLEIFVRQFALPSLIFLTLASVELSRVNWGVIKCFALAKSIVFIIVLLITISVTKPINVGKAGLYAIFCTQSNDLCLGLPIVESLYQPDHPEFSHYLYLLALVQYLMLNPFGFFLMELQRRGNQHGRLDKSVINLLGALARSTFLNPIIAMTFLGMLANICWSNQVPVILEKFLDVLGVAFPATALFCLGYSLVATSDTLMGKRLITSLLIVTKVLIMPLVNRFIMHMYIDVTQPSEKGIYENFAFLYGTIPTAPTVYIFATQFGMKTDVVSSGMVVSTFLSAPLMFLSGSMSTVTDFASSYLQKDLSEAVTYSSILGTLCSLWVLGVFIKAKITRSVTHGLTIYIVTFQLLAALGGTFQSIRSPHSRFVMYAEHFISVVGILSSHIWTALLAINISVLYGRSLCFAIYIQKYIKIFGLSAFFFVSVAIGAILEEQYRSKEKTDIDFLFNGADASVSAAVLVTCTFSIIFSLIIQHWHVSSYSVRPLLQDHENLIDTSTVGSEKNPDICAQNISSDEQEGMSDIEELHYPSCIHLSNVRLQSLTQPFPIVCHSSSNCIGTNKNICAGNLKNYFLNMQESRKQGITFELYEDSHQVVKHVTLVIFIFIAMIISLIINLWKVLLKGKSDIYIELEFLNACLCHGLGIISFAIFGLDKNLVINPWESWLRQLCYGSDALVLPETRNLPLKTQHICNMFLTYHAKNCVCDIVKDMTIGTRRYSNVFSGKDFVDWILKVGLSHSRLEAEAYGNHLLVGRIIKHIKQRYYFQDSPHLYMFNVSI